MDPLAVLSVEKAKDHLNKLQMVGPGGEDELRDMIGAAVERVRDHLGRWPNPASYQEVLACKVVLADYWRTQSPASSRTRSVGVSGPDDDGLTSSASTAAKLTALLGPAVSRAESRPMGRFPSAAPFPDPAEPVTRWWGVLRG